MTKFVHPDAEPWFPRPGERVRGLAGKRMIVGTVEESRKDETKAAVSSRKGIVGIFVRLDDGSRVAAMKLRPVVMLVKESRS